MREIALLKRSGFVLYTVNPVFWLRRLRSGYAAVTNETSVVTQVTQFLPFSAYTCACARDGYLLINVLSCFFKTIRNCVTCVTTRFLFVTG